MYVLGDWRNICYLGKQAFFFLSEIYTRLLIPFYVITLLCKSQKRHLKASLISLFFINKWVEDAAVYWIICKYKYETVYKAKMEFVES